MKYLKTYESYNTDLSDRVEDILVDLSDDGFGYNVNMGHFDKTFAINIYKRGTGSASSLIRFDRFRWMDVKDTITKLVNNLFSDYQIENCILVVDNKEYDIVKTGHITYDVVLGVRDIPEDEQAITGVRLRFAKREYKVYEDVDINETVWTSGNITGPRAIWAPIVISTLEDVGIVIDRMEWKEPPVSYGMSYEMKIKRLSLDIKCGGADVRVCNIMQYLNSFIDQMKADGIGVLTIKVYFNGILDEEDPDDITPLSYDFFEDSDDSLMDYHKDAIVTRIYLTVKKFDDISKYNREYIDKYKSLTNT